MGSKFLDKLILKTLAVAIGGVRQECLRMAGLARDSLRVFIKEDHKLMQYVEQKEELLDSLEKEIIIYLA
jgi:Na+/phosphate symporter